MSENNGHALVMELRQRYLECGICTEVYDECVHVPKLLPCLHTFCIKCIITIHKGNSLTCPLCNQMHNLKKGELSSLPKDNTRRDLADFLEKHKKCDLEKCAICRKNKHLSVKCETCVMRICSDCQQKHQRKYPMHDFVTGLLSVTNEIKENDLCDQTGHDRGRLRYFCKDLECEKVLCATCVITEHKNHPVENIDLIISDRKKSFQQLLQSVRKKHTTVKDLDDRSKKSIQLLNDQAKTYRKKVNDSYAKGVQKLREKKEKVIDCLEKVHERNEKRLNTTNEKLASFLVNANECCNISEELLRNATKSSFLTLERTVSEHLRNFLISAIDQLDVQGNSLSNEIDEISNKI
ncbi:TRIM2_3 [Mytilus coruscus]|uniref:TRIM2_3 n=1 Tax=Mytilus coruscus TaxID=42192 RepID=A0A6J8EVL1_MYTCO|nr:TRIM2_3 [Mytilus coruscus]